MCSAQSRSAMDPGLMYVCAATLQKKGKCDIVGCMKELKIWDTGLEKKRM